MKDMAEKTLHYYYTKACNEFSGRNSASLRSAKTALFEEMLQRWRTVDNTMSDVTTRNLNLKPIATETNAFTIVARPTLIVELNFIFILLETAIPGAKIVNIALRV